MPENTVEILIRARDEATRVLNQVTAQIQQMAAGAEQASTRAAVGAVRLAQSSISATRQISALSATTRFASFGLIQELSPALGTTVPRMASLSAVAATTGNVLSGVLLAGGITAVIAGLGLLIRRVKDTIDAENAYAEALEKGTLGPIAKRIEALTKLQQAIERGRPSPADIAGAVTGFEAIGGGGAAAVAEDRAEAIRQLRLQARRQDADQAQAFINEQNKKRFDEDKKLQERIAEGSEASAKHFAAAQRLALEAEGVITEAQGASLEALHQQLLERWDALDKDLQDRIRKYDDLRAKVISEGQRLAVEAEGAITDQQAAQISALQQDFEERTLEGLRRAQQPIVNAMTTLGHASADALFDAMTGRARNLGEAAKSLIDGILRDIFRNTLAKFFGGQSQGFSLQNLLSLGGGGSPFASLAAGVPSVGGLAGLEGPARAASFAPGTAAEIEARGAGGLFTTEAPGAFLGGLAGVGIGALWILGASQAQDPLSGALSGGLGGLSAGLGLASLGLGASAVLGPIGLVAGLAFGLLSGASKGRKAKRERARQARAQRQIELIQDADTLEELEALSVIGLEPEAQAALRQQATPLVLEAGRREIAETRSLAGIEAILARGVSPDVGGLELRAEAERRRQEILGTLEGIGAIGIEEQLEGGIRRTTRVGAGAFGLARARQMGGDIILDATARRRLQREMLVDDVFVDEFLRRALDRAGTRGIRIEPSRL